MRLLLFRPPTGLPGALGRIAIDRQYFCNAEQVIVWIERISAERTIHEAGASYAYNHSHERAGHRCHLPLCRILEILTAINDRT